MTFAELLAKYDPQSQVEWQRQASQEWRGRPVEDFLLQFGAAPAGAASTAQVLPFYATTTPGQPAPAEAPDDVRAWTIFSHSTAAKAAAALQGETLAAHLLQELDFGAQGLCLTVDQLQSLQGYASAIRFDFLSLYITDQPDRVSAVLQELVPAGQAAGLNLYLPWQISTTSKYNELIESFPQVHLVIDLGNVDLSIGCVEAADIIAQALESNIAQPQPIASPKFVIRYSPPADYLFGVALPGALRDLYHLAHKKINSSAAHSPEIFAHVQSDAATGQTAEAYLIDATVRLTAALSGGIDAAAVAPFGDSVRYRREALNLQHVLALESGLAGMPHPTTGSPFFAAVREALLAGTGASAA